MKLTLPLLMLFLCGVCAAQNRHMTQSDNDGKAEGMTPAQLEKAFNDQRARDLTGMKEQRKQESKYSDGLPESSLERRQRIESEIFRYHSLYGFRYYPYIYRPYYRQTYRWHRSSPARH